ncbi:MAG: thiolase family protein [Veillonellales bacterium]
MKPVYIIGGVRTPIGKTGGVLKEWLPENLGAAVLKETIARYRISPENIEQVIMGNAVGPGGNIARICVLAAGWPYSIPAVTVDTQCGSGLSAVQLAADCIRAGSAEMIIAGGVESTSMEPRRQFNNADPRFQGENVYFTRAPFSTPEIGDPDTGIAAENLAAKMKISRQDMDHFAWESHQRAFKTRQQELLKDIILPVQTTNKIVDQDECIRGNITLRLLQRMKPAFVPGGSITAGNTCLKHDGAAVLLLASEQAVQKYKLLPQGKVIQTAICGCDPNFFPLAPVFSIHRLLEKAGMALSDIAAMEINEAFAVKILACCRELDFDLQKTNILGGALAYGHPYGASGAIILLHLLKALKLVDGRFGIAAIGAVGGQGIATLIERD